MDYRHGDTAALIDRQRITDVIHRYCRATDRLDVQLFMTTFWEDGGFEGGPAVGSAIEVIPSLFPTCGKPVSTASPTVPRAIATIPSSDPVYLCDSGR